MNIGRLRKRLIVRRKKKKKKKIRNKSRLLHDQVPHVQPLTTLLLLLCTRLRPHPHLHLRFQMNVVID
ncbi:hypothetical protein LINPERHAP2_LOCUS41513 [Linum perenne]